MGQRLHTRCLAVVLAASAWTAATLAAETVSTLDLVSSEAALCVEIPHLNDTWSTIENGPLMQRLRAVPVYQRLLDSRGFQQWQMIEDHVARQTGQKLSAQLRALFGKSLVLAVYVPPTGQPRGILIGEALDPSAIDIALSTLNKLEPNEVITARTYHGTKYQQRKKRGNAPESTYVVTFDRLFAVSDQEALIHDLVDRYTIKSQGRSAPAASLGQSNLFQQGRQRLKSDAAVYLHVNARAWDRGLEEAARNEHDPVNPAEIWKHVSSVSACLMVDRGLVLDSAINLDSSHRPDGWSQFVSAATVEPAWPSRIPAEALIAISGHLELAPFIRHFLNQLPQHDKVELTKNRRIAESLLGGQELFDTVLPKLARDFCGSVVTRNDQRSGQVVLDGSVAFHLNSSGDAKLLQDMIPGLETGLNLLAAYFSAQGPNIVTVQREHSEATRTRWLSETAPFPIALGITATRLVVAGSHVRLDRSLETLEKGGSHPRLTDHSQRYFPKANQLVWFDAAQTRQVLERHGSDLARLLSHGSSEESARLMNRFEHVRPMLSLVDSLFIASRFEADHIRVVVGGGIDAK